ncbi:penicillin-binding protein, 1A family [Desulfocurvibacter africanus PCS]|uniref:Penicillin-binding protein 1A n=1 Tax=Desulfocurvibacter africanus PCS TaxID=1262666 RepID=M5PPM6_DESAF|nr:PBP1A family penicillin-binding protein [Desulfocurvibacter africanus]EMG36242.1 penicillin-binding protein, 1A family [Desulfocurvibacter africanus PCS]
MKKILIVTLVIMAFGITALAAGAVGLYVWASKDLPGFKRIADYNPPLVTTVYSRNGKVLGYFYKEKRFLVTLAEMPKYLPEAFLAAEDSGFYQHDGVDTMAIARAFLANMRAGGIRQGGSTITQQIIKQLLLSPERSYSRKIKEAILAYRLERYLTKEEILTIYLNQIYLGAGAYGVEAAARAYFGKHVNELSLAEAAVLAGLPQAPSNYNPYQHPESAINRQRYVLNRMLESGWINREQYERSLVEPLEFKSMPDPSWKLGAYYLEEVRRWLVERYGEQAVYEGGLHVRAALDMTHQEAAENAMRKGLEESARRRGWEGSLMRLRPEEHAMFLADEALPSEALEPGSWLKVLVTQVSPQGALVRFGDLTGEIPLAQMSWAREPDSQKSPEEVPPVTDATTVLRSGDVVWAEVLKKPAQPNEARWSLALRREPSVEGALVSIRPDSGEVLALVGGYSFQRSQFNRATQALRQPGSAFKPIVYSAALDNGYTPASVLLDAPVVYTDEVTSQIWKPDNFEGVFYGPTLLRTALVKSRNLVTIRIAQKIGIKTIIERAKAMGLVSNFPQDLSVALGSAVVTPLNLCQAYTAFARGGSYINPRLVLDVVSAWGESLYASQPEPVEAISPQTAYIVTSMLKDVVQSGTGWRAKALKRPVAGKTGTSNDERDAWFLGFTPYLVTGVFVGFDSNEPMGKYETGARAASPIWVDYRAAVEEQFPFQDFPRPAGVTMVSIDPQSGLLAGPNSTESLFLPFLDGSAPTEMASGSDSPTTMGVTPAEGEDLFKQVY